MTLTRRRRASLFGAEEASYANAAALSFHEIIRIRSPGVRTESKMSHDVLSALHGLSPSHCAQLYGSLACVTPAGRVALMRVIVVPSPTSVSSRRCSVSEHPWGSWLSAVIWPTRRW